jgi:hypothetical protein
VHIYAHFDVRVELDQHRHEPLDREALHFGLRGCSLKAVSNSLMSEALGSYSRLIGPTTKMVATARA